MSDNVTWVPIAPGESVDYDMHIGPNAELRVATELGEMVVEFEDDVRLCRAVAMPAPDWSQAPEWAQWWAVDPGGSWAWFREKPDAYDGPDWGQWETDGRFLDGPTHLELPPSYNWRKSLQSRPEDYNG